jgi:IS30 family transposase
MFSWFLSVNAKWHPLSGKRGEVYLDAFHPEHLRAIEHRINTTPRRIHGWSTAQHVYDAAAAMTG